MQIIPNIVDKNIKYILPAILIVILLSFSVNALTPIGGFCLNNDECVSPHICEGGYCREENIMEYISGLLEDILNQLAPSTPLTITGDTPPPSSNGGGRSPSWRGSSGVCVSNWTCTEWTACISDKKTRTCTDINDCQLEEPIYGKPSEEMLCQLSPTPTCTDGILNQNEENVDCGGVCEPCKTCDDGILNCHEGICEEGIDCGGPCMPCSWWKASKSPTFWIIFTTGILTIILLLLGFWYFKLRSSAQDIGDKFTEQEFFKLK